MRARSQAYIVENNEFFSPATTVIANCVEDTISRQSWKQLLNEQSQQDATDDSQVEIVNHERTIKDKSLAMLHQLSSTEDYDIV